MAVVALPFEVLMASLGGRNLGHYFITMIPAVILAVSYPLWRFIAGLRLAVQSKGRLGTAIYLIPVLLVLAWAVKFLPSVVPAAKNTGQLAALFKNQSTADDLEKYIDQTTQPQDEVLVWHIHLGINFIADRKSPSRYLFPLNLFIPPTEGNTKLKEYIDELEHKPPELILVQNVSSTHIPFVDEPIESECAVYCSTEFTQALMVPQINQQWHRFQEFFYAHYAWDTAIYDWKVYRLTP
jgi:hypothetical protein